VKWPEPPVAGAIGAALFLRLMFGDVSAGGNHPIATSCGDWKPLVMETVLTGFVTMRATRIILLAWHRASGWWRSPGRPKRPGQEYVVMAAEPPDSPVAEAVRSLEVRWIFPGQLKAAVAGWFGRFPARVESREDTYLLDPQLRGLSVKVGGGGALEVKVYYGSPGILEVAGHARGRLESWQKRSFPSARSAPAAATHPAGGQYANGGASAGSHSPADSLRYATRGWPSSRGARWNSPRSA